MKHRVLAIVMCGVMAAAGGLLAGCSHERIVDGIVYSPDTNRDGREEYAIWRVEEGVRVVRPLDELDGRPVTTIWLAGNEEIEEIYFPKHVTFVRDMTIDHCTNLKKVDLNDGLLSIQSLAFTGLPNLHELSIPSSVRQIMQNAFYNDPEGADGHAACTLAINYEGTLEEMMGIEFALGGHFGVGTSFTLQGEPLTDAELPESVKAIPAYAFSYLRDLQTVTIGESLTAIGTQAFYHCTALTEITYGGSKEEWLAIEKGDDWNTYYDSESDDTAVLPLTVYCSDGAIAYGEQAEDEAAV